MSAKVTFIMGRSGSGKTELILNRIKQNELNGRRSVLIVPDRASFESEKRLSGLMGHGIMNTFVVSFTRLARRILSERGEKRVFLSMQGRQMLLRRTIEEHGTELKAFSRIALRQGFTGECDEIILKCKRFGITPEQLASAAGDESLPLSLRDKLRDFALIFEKTADAMAESYIDDEDVVNSLISELPESSYRDCDFFIDTPETLTEQSIRVISVLFGCAPSVTISFRGDTSESCRDRRLFAPDEELYRRIRNEASEQGCEIEFISLTDNRRARSPELIHLERELFAFPYRRFTAPASEPAAIELHTAGSRIQEVAACAETIRRAVRGGLRYRDIGIIVSDTEVYAPIIGRTFPDYGIPFFMDAKRVLFAHPIAELLLASLNCCESGFRAQSFIRAIKSGLFPVEAADIERLENHILKYGLNGNLITEPFDQADVPEGVEEARAAAVGPLMGLKQRVSGRIRSSERIEAVYAFLEELRIGEKLRQECTALAEAGDLTAARETAQVFDTLVELLDQLHVIIGDETVSLKKFTSILEEGLKAYSVGIIPTTLDQVFIGSVDNSAVTEVEFLLVLGVNDGAIPKTKADNAIISDSELSRLSAAGLSVWSSTDKMNRAENLRVYSALMRARRRLRLSYAGSDGGGSPSGLFERIRKLFPDCLMTNGIIEPIVGSTERARFAELVSGLKHGISAGEAELDAFRESYAYFAASPEYSARLAVMDKAMFETNADECLDRDTALKLYGSRIYGSPTKLETFGKCPFRYFMEFGIGIKEREEYEEKASDRGSFIHAALERFIKGLIDDDIDWGSLTDEDIEKRLSEIIQILASEHNRGIYLSSARMRAELGRLGKSIFIAAIELVRQIAGGAFRPIQGEVGFGRPGDPLPALTITASNGSCFHVCGIVDRLDGFSPENGDADYLRIVDYKSGDTVFNFTELVNGIRLQLPLYAAAMEAGLDAERKLSLNPCFPAKEDSTTAGFYYQYIGTPDAETEELSEAEAQAVIKEVRDSFRLRGLTLDDESVILAMDAHIKRYSNVIRGVQLTKEGIRGSVATAEEMRYAIDYAKAAAARTLDSIMQGRMEVSPIRCNGKTGCSYCKLRSICGFDPTAGARYRNAAKVSADAFFGRDERK